MCGVLISVWVGELVFTGLTDSPVIWQSDISIQSMNQQISRQCNDSFNGLMIIWPLTLPGCQWKDWNNVDDSKWMIFKFIDVSWFDWFAEFHEWIVSQPVIVNFKTQTSIQETASEFDSMRPWVRPGPQIVQSLTIKRQLLFDCHCHHYYDACHVMTVSWKSN